MTDQGGEDSSQLTTTDLGKQFGNEWAVRGVSLEVHDAKVVGLVGPSGCGKTTLVRMLNGAIRPDEGSVRVLGADPTTFGRRDQQRIGYLPQQPVLFPELSLWENLNFHASLAGVRFRRRRRLRELLDFVDLGPDRRKKVSESSGGMQRRLALAATLIHKPQVLFLDEPTAGIDPILRRKIWDRLHDLRDEGTMLIVTTQYVAEAAYCDDVGVLSDGRLLSLSPPESLARSAYGGELLDLTTDAVLSHAGITELQDIEGVVRIERPTATTTRVIVTEASEVAESIRHWLIRHDLDSSTIDQPNIDYDDVFVRTIEQSRAHESQRPEAASTA